MVPNLYNRYNKEFESQRRHENTLVNRFIVYLYFYYILCYTSKYIDSGGYIVGNHFPSLKS